MQRGRIALLGPLFLAVFPLVFLYGENTGEGISFLEFIVPFAIVLTAAALLVLLLRLLVKDDAAVGVADSILIVALFPMGLCPIGWR